MTGKEVRLNRASAHPTKAFFVRMLTRDISLEDCILDLVDNSIDAAWRRSSAKPTDLRQTKKLSAYRIDVTITENSFEILDNCGGIGLDDAVEYAFTFGRQELAAPTDGYTVGVYGIGMKRAVFKLGNDVAVRSSPLGEDESFVVPIDVATWLSDSRDVWDFAIEPADPLPEPGVEIVVRELSDETAATFSDPGFVEQLRATLARDYMLPLMHGLEISLNGKTITGWGVTFKESREFSPMRQQYDEGDVSVEIIAGMTGSPPDSSEPSDKAGDRDSGWYVLCNGRVVVAADRSDLTVWGRDRFPNWHPQFNGFTGVVLFTSVDASLLPMTTTKRSVDVSSALYRRAVVKMQKPTRAWIDYTNAWKGRRELARTKEQSARSVPISKVKTRVSVKLPKGTAGPTDANVLYTVSKARVRKLGSAFGKSTMSYKEVGERSFEYAYERLVDED